MPTTTAARRREGAAHAQANVEAEQALLGVLLYDNAALKRIGDFLQARHFFEPFHGRLYAALETYIRKGQLAEPILIAEQFQRDPAFEPLGGLRYLVDLVDRAPPAANAPDYARAIYDLALRRDPVLTGGEIVASASGSSTDRSAHDQIEAGETVHRMPFSYIDIFRASPVERIRIIKAGVPAANAKRMIKDLAFDQQAMLAALNLSTATVNRKAARGEPLTPDESERVVGVAKLVGQLQSMVEDTGDASGFDAAGWLSQWLREPVPALGGAKPVDLLDTMEGQALVSHALARIESGAYA